MYPELNELVFSVLVSYMGVLELIFVMKHLYHWLFQHQKQLLGDGPDGESLEELQNRIKEAIEEAKANEFGDFKAMKDGVLYKDGFRVDPDTIAKQEQPRRELIGSSRNSLEDRREEVHEEPCVKKVIQRSASPARVDSVVLPVETEEPERTNLIQTIKTQIGQSNSLQVQPHKSEDSSSNEPMSSQPSLSNQQSSSIETMPSLPDIHFDEYERQAPDGEDVPDEKQYSDDYLRSLDGIKHRPLVREDGTGRRRAFKKRRSSGDSTSSRESRTSREEELKMFTSLEEEEFEAMKRGDNDYVPIRYSSEPNLKVGKHHKRHKKSPVKDSRQTSDIEENKSSLEMLDEEESNPWGEIKPEHYKNTEFWQREKTISIEEEDDETNLNAWHKNSDEKTPSRAGLQPESQHRNIPKKSSFEEATDTQHEVAINVLKQQSSIDKEQIESKKDSFRQNHENVSMDHNSDDDTTTTLEPLAAKSNASPATLDATNTCDISNSPVDLDDDQENDLAETDDYQNESAPPLLRHSKKAFRDLSLQDDWEDEEFPPPEDIDQDYVPEQEEESIADDDDSDYNQTPPSYVDEFDETSLATSTTGFEVRSYSLPEIEIEESAEQSAEQPAEPSILEGLSDFYDFNASINPSRSPSPFVERSKSKTPRPVSRLSFHSDDPGKRSPPIKKIEKVEDLEGLSDFFDFSVMLNRAAYGHTVQRSRSAHRTSVDYLVENLEVEKPKTAIKKNDKKSLLDVNSTVLFSPIVQSPNTPPSPECRRSFSTDQREIERLREKHQKNAFQRSTYVGESTDFDDDFEELREQTRHFQRSRSKSRSLIEEELDVLDEEDSRSSSRRALQDKILAEITKTTINYQEFSRDMNQKFIDHERRGSDSALIPKPEILIHIDSERKDGRVEDDEAELEAEEYHHFRRFSLNQEYQVEEYPNDSDYIYIEQIEVRSIDGNRTWTREDFYDREGDVKIDSIEEIPSVSLESLDDSDRDPEADDTGSEDERQTIVEVADEIDEDIWESNRQEDQSDDDNTAGEEFRLYENGNLNEGDWKEEGAVGGAVDEPHESHENSLTIEEIYDEAVRNHEESSIERDYDTIFEAVDTKPREMDDTISMKTEDLLEEILNEDDHKYHWRSKKSSAAFLDHERGSTSSTTSTLLRSRYGIGTTSLSYTSSYEVGESVSPTETYAPKKEYNWRKNFKLDDDNEDEDSSNATNLISKHDRKLSFNVEESEMTEQQQQQHLDFLDIRKMSLGGESITLYSRTPDRFADFPSEDEEKIDQPVDDLIVRRDKTPIEETEEANVEAPTKKKKKKKITRKGSKASIEDISETASRKLSIDENQTIDEEDSPKKKTIKKKKKKTKDHSIELVDSKENSPPSPNLESPKRKSPVKTASKSQSSKSEHTADGTTLLEEATSKTKEPSPLPTSSADQTVRTPSPKLVVPETKPGPSNEPGGTTASGSTTARTRPPFERNESTGAYELIKDGSMYPWF